MTDAGAQALEGRGVRSTYSQAPFRITCHDLGGQISTGTGFHYSHRGRRYVVTNWHVVTGRDAFTGLHLDRQNARTPLWIELHTAHNFPELGEETFGIVPHRFELFDDLDAPFDPRWLQHPEAPRDVVAIPLERPDWEPPNFHNSVNNIGQYRVPVRPGVTAFVIGFPQGLRTGFGLPIWKSTFIASEPHYQIEVGNVRIPAFFLDGRTRPGMSGSPVFAQFIGTWDTTNPYRNVDPDAPDFWTRRDVALGANAMEFVGIYSGRLTGGVEDDAALGLCWTEATIAEVCATDPFWQRG